MIVIAFVTSPKIYHWKKIEEDVNILIMNI